MWPLINREDIPTVNRVRDEVVNVAGRVRVRVKRPVPMLNAREKECLVKHVRSRFEEVNVVIVDGEYVLSKITAKL